MKIPLLYQITEYDCGTISFINALCYLYEREELSPRVIKYIYTNTLDCYYGRKGEKCCGTTQKATKRIVKWLNYYSSGSFRLRCRRLIKKEVTMANLLCCLKEKGVIIVKCWQGVEHYVVITKIEKDYAYLFDPYYVKTKTWNGDSQIKIILNHPFSYNRKVTLKRLLSKGKKDFSLGKVAERECILIQKIR